MVEPGEPSAREIRAFMSAGKSQIEAADHFGIHRSKVQRILRSSEDDRGPIEQSVDALIAKWGHLDEGKALKADMLRAAACNADAGRRVRTGAAIQAANQALDLLWKFIEAMDQASGVEDLKAFLLADDE